MATKINDYCVTVTLCILFSFGHGRPHIGANGVKWKNGWKIKKQKHAKKCRFLCLCYILRAIRAGRCRERRYADHIFIQIYFSMQLVAWHSGRTSVSGRRTFTVLCSTCSWWVTTNVAKPSAIGQPTRPTQPFILLGSIKWVVSWNQMCAAVYR